MATSIFKALSHPARIRTLAIIERHQGEEGISPKRMHVLMTLPRPPFENVAYHVRALRDHGLICLVDRRPMSNGRGSNVTQSFYKITARGHAAMALARDAGEA